MMALRSALASLLLLLAASLLQHLHPAAAEDTALDEGTIMRRLRRLANDAGLVGRQEGKWTGWGRDDPAHHCSWHNVVCDASQHVTQILWKTEGPVHFELQPLSNSTSLLPELAQLRFLTRLEMEFDAAVVGLPPEWGRTGAFPSLQYLALTIPAFTGPEPLPPVQPGAVPRLEDFSIILIGQRRPMPLPETWGLPGIWPSLRAVHITGTIELPLPASWAHGFPVLEQLFLDSNTKRGPTGRDPAANRSPATATDAPTPDADTFTVPDGPSHPLPPEWSRGFHKLQALTLAYLGLNGTFPAAWQAKGSFPQLRELELGGNRLSGTLPADILCNLPNLQFFELGNNHFIGGAPPEWAACAAHVTELGVQHNQLTGPAFPPAWLAPNSTLNLRRLQLSDNVGLVGSLPPSLNWSRLEVLKKRAHTRCTACHRYLHNTSVDGRIPEEWCRARFARTIQQIDTDAVRKPSFLSSQPACVAKDMPTFATWAKQVLEQIPTERAGVADTALASGSGSGRLLLLLALLAASAAAAAAVLTGQSRPAALAWAPAWLQRRLRSRAPMAAEDEGVELLRREADAKPNSRRRLPKPRELAPGRARLKALVQRQLGGTALLSGRPEAQLLSMLNGTAHSLAASADGLMPVAAGYHSGANHPGGTAHGGAATVRLVRHWGLPTESLRMAPADLQFIAESDGSLVQLGEGAHGVVYLAKMQEDMYVAVKVFAVQHGMDSQAFWREISLLARCVHPRIVPVYGVAMHGELVMVAMQLMLGGSLRVALADPEQHGELRWSNRGRQVALDVAEAIAYLHEKAHILHSDIKSDNVLLSQDWRAALTDLGVGQVMESTARTAAGGSKLYAAPEQLLGQRCTLAADIYSLGLLLAELTTRKPIVKRGQWELPRPPDDCPQDVADLIGQCLSSDPRQRPTAAEVLRRLRASGGERCARMEY